MYFRIFCSPTSKTVIGKLAWSFIDLLLEGLGHTIRLLPPPGPLACVNLENLEPAWERFRPLFNQAVDGPFVNVVVSDDPSEWTRLWTTNVHNILLTTTVPPLLDPQHLIYGGAYSAVVVPEGDSRAVHAAWCAARSEYRATRDMACIELPADWTMYDAEMIQGAVGLKSAD